MIRAEVRSERWPFTRPFEVARDVYHDVPMIHVRLVDGAGHAGQAEAAGIDYDGETPETMSAQIAALGPAIGRAAIDILPAGGARNALDCAWWDAPVRGRGELLRAWRPYVEGQLAQGVALKHLTRHVLGLFQGQRGGRAFRQILSEGAHRPGAGWALVEQALAPTEPSHERAA